MSKEHKRIVLIRHGETKYKNIFPDLTETGINQIQAVAKALKYELMINPKTCQLISSPSVRALGSAHIINQEFPLGEPRIEKLIANFDIKDHGAVFNEIVQPVISQATDPAEKIRLMDEAYIKDPVFEKRKDILEPRSKVENRTFKALAKFCRELLDSETTDTIVALTHFEIINHIIWNNFPKIKESGESIKPAEMLIISILGKSEGKFRLRLKFRNQEEDRALDCELN